MNISLLQSTRVGGWTLKLQTQEGDCIITQIGGMGVVGTVWHYPEGLANTVSQFRVATLSKLMISYDAAKYHKIGNTKHLCYEVTTGEGKCCRFLLTPEGFHE